MKSHFGDGRTGVAIQSNSLAHIESQYKYPWYFFHRVDLHSGLKDLAFGEGGQRIPAVLKLQSRLASVVSLSLLWKHVYLLTPRQNATDSSLNFADGSVVNADLIIGADGVHVIHHLAFCLISLSPRNSLHLSNGWCRMRRRPPKLDIRPFGFLYRYKTCSRIPKRGGS